MTVFEDIRDQGMTGRARNRVSASETSRARAVVVAMGLCPAPAAPPEVFSNQRSRECSGC
jgi:hypothetical protein